MAALLSATPALGQTAAERLPVCLACHGANGVSPSPSVPSLGAMPPDYLVVQLYMFREGQRVAAPMNAMAKGLSDDDLQSLADTIAALPAPPPAPALADAEQEQARTLLAKYHCTSCHGAGLAGHDQIPRLAGQHEAYLATALTAYKTNARPGYDPAMSEASQEVKAEDIPLLARAAAAHR